MRCRMWPHNSLGGFHLRYGRVLIHRTGSLETPHYVSAVLGQQSLISANLLSCTWTLLHRRLIDRKENTKTLTSPPMGPWGPCGPCCPGGPWWEAERLSISHIIRHVLSLSLSPLFAQSAPFSMSERCFFVHLWHGGDRLLQAGWFPLCVLCLRFNEDHLTSPFSGYTAWILNSWGIPLIAAEGGTRAINQTGQNCC